jgi:hypothetical protein
METEKENALLTAQMKRAQGRGLKNSEIALLRHNEKVKVFERSPRTQSTVMSEADTRTSLQSGRDSLASVARATDSSLAARVATLETLLAGLSRQTITYCSGGSSSSKTIVMS